MTCDTQNVNNNILDDDFIKLYKPLIYIQTMLGSARVRIRHKRILMPMKIQTGYSIVFVAANVAAVIIAESSRSHDDKMLVMILVQIYQGLFVNICIIFFNNTLNRGCMMELLLTLQSIDRELKVIGKSRHTNKIYTFMITCTTTILIMMAMHAAQIIVYLDPSKILYFIFSFFIYFNMDFEFIFFVTVMIHLHNRICYINELIAFGCEVHWQQKHMETEVYQRIWKAIVGAGRALRLIEKIFRVYVLLLGVHFFIYHMVASEKIILMPEMSVCHLQNLTYRIRYKSQVKLVTFLVFSVRGVGFFAPNVNHSCVLAPVSSVLVIRVRVCTREFQVYLLSDIESHHTRLEIPGQEKA
ncbi:hypothetical protein B5X24_HaOG215732 [Helicoverpa armigera]|nr:hypothetical protein B5X24_HaOG215732 [Helicoverpa armigera]